MRKKIFILIFMLLGFNFCCANYLKIGYVDIKEVFEGYEEAQESLKLLEVELKEKESHLENLNKELEKLEKELQSQEMVLTTEIKDKRKKEIKTKKEKLIQLAQTYEDGLKAKNEELQKKYLQKINEVINTIGQEEKYDIIIEKNLILYGREEFNISDKIILYLNRVKKEAK